MEWGLIIGIIGGIAIPAFAFWFSMANKRPYLDLASENESPSGHRFLVITVTNPGSGAVEARSVKIQKPDGTRISSPRELRQHGRLGEDYSAALYLGERVGSGLSITRMLGLELPKGWSGGKVKVRVFVSGAPWPKRQGWLKGVIALGPPVLEKKSLEKSEHPRTITVPPQNRTIKVRR